MPTQEIADHVAAVANRALDAADIEALRLLILDNFLVSHWGMTRPVAQAISGWSKRFAGTGSSPVLGGSWTTDASTAALVHGTAGHAYELDDAHDETLGHPGCVVIPAALAVACEIDATQIELFQAIAAGYEAMALVGCAAGGMETVHRGFHPTSVFGPFGAATATLCLHAYRNKQAVTRQALMAAWGHALSQAGGSMQFSLETTGGEVKRVHAGLAARNGIIAAEFAMLPAITAPQLAVEGGYGVAALFGGPLRPVALGGRLQLHFCSKKPYACCRLFHSTIDALSEITGGFQIPTSSMVEIVVSGPQLIAEQHMIAAESAMTAQYSCPYIVGATLAYGPERFDAYGEEFHQDPRILELAAKVRFECSEELEKSYYPKRFATGASIRFTDGTTKSAIVVDSVGTPRKPMSKKQILAKGAGLASRGEFTAGTIIAELLWNEGTGSRDLAKALVG